MRSATAQLQAIPSERSFTGMVMMRTDIDTDGDALWRCRRRLRERSRKLAVKARQMLASSAAYLYSPDATAAAGGASDLTVLGTPGGMSPASPVIRGPGSPGTPATPGFRTPVTGGGVTPPVPIASAGAEAAAAATLLSEGDTAMSSPTGSSRSERPRLRQQRRRGSSSQQRRQPQQQDQPAHEAMRLNPAEPFGESVLELGMVVAPQSRAGLHAADLASSIADRSLISDAPSASPEIPRPPEPRLLALRESASRPSGGSGGVGGSDWVAPSPASTRRPPNLPSSSPWQRAGSMNSAPHLQQSWMLSPSSEGGRSIDPESFRSMLRSPKSRLRSTRPVRLAEVPRESPTVRTRREIAPANLGQFSKSGLAGVGENEGNRALAGSTLSASNIPAASAAPGAAGPIETAGADSTRAHVKTGGEDYVSPETSASLEASYASVTHSLASLTVFRFALGHLVLVSAALWGTMDDKWRRTTRVIVPYALFAAAVVARAGVAWVSPRLFQRHYQFVTSLALLAATHCCVVVLSEINMLWTGFGCGLMILFNFFTGLHNLLLFPHVFVLTVACVAHMVADGIVHAVQARFIVIYTLSALAMLLLAYRLEKRRRFEFVLSAKALVDETRAFHLLEQMLPTDVIMHMSLRPNDLYAKNMPTAHVLMADVVSFTSMSSSMVRARAYPLFPLQRLPCCCCSPSHSLPSLILPSPPLRSALRS